MQTFPNPHAQALPHSPIAGFAMHAPPALSGRAHHPMPREVARVRWGRIAVTVIGIALIAFGVWNGLRAGATASKGTSASRAAGAAIADRPKLDVADTPTVAPRVTPAAPRVTPPARAGRHGATGHRRGGTPPVARGSGTGGAAQAATLPYTGAETWIVAILGIALLAGGIALQINAVRIGMVAMLYRRGILLRPIECARLAQGRTLPRARVHVSRLLERLLAEPELSRDFATATR